eukprot:7443077-Pyramimonas_sp.AAC.1
MGIAGLFDAHTPRGLPCIVPCLTFHSSDQGCRISGVDVFCLVITLHTLDALLTSRLARRLLFSCYLSPVGL